MTDHKEDLVRIDACCQAFQKLCDPGIGAGGALVSVEAAAEEDDRNSVLGQFPDQVPEADLAVQAAVTDHEGLLGRRRHANLLREVFLRGHLSAEAGEGGRLPVEGLQAGGEDAVLGLAHGFHFLRGEVQEALQGQLLVDGIRSVEGAAVGALNTVDAAFQILPERVVPQDAEIVEPDIGGELEFQHDAGFFEILHQLFSAGGAEIGGIETVADPHGRHCLAGSEGFLHAAETAGYIVAQGVIFTGVDPDHEARIGAGDSHKLPNQGREVPDTVDLLADDVRTGHVGVGGNGP